MILVDTSVWVAHLRFGEELLASALAEGDVLVHPFVIGELACGNISRRGEILELLGQLPFAREATHDEVHALIERRRLMGRGIGFVDAHLLASTALTPEARLWTHDKRLAQVAAELVR